MFFVVVLSIWTGLNAYVGWRLAGLPWVGAHIGTRLLAAVLVPLWLGYPLARILAARGFHSVSIPLEWVGSTWIGVVFLLFVAFLAMDVLTLGGALLPKLAPLLRTGAALTALVLAGAALVQGLRAPVVREFEIALPGLPAERDGFTLVAVSDLHLGTLIGPRWLSSMVAQIDRLQPDAVVIVGDLVDSDFDRARALQPELEQLRASHGVWLALGNHDVYAGAAQVARFGEAAGLGVLRNRAVELVPGLTLAGIDDPASRRRRDNTPDTRLTRALVGAPAGAPAGATILLAHTPESADVEAAARAGVGLMISGHTHGGQIWPFSYLVRHRFPFFVGHYEVGGLQLVVGRGTGTWGPRMRLWHPGEILRLRLRSVTSPP